MEYCLAIDIGASSGRHILGSLQGGKIKLEEIYRFENKIKKVEDEYCWDIKELFKNIKDGIKKCKEIGKIPKTIGIDTWGVDFVLLDEKDEMLGRPVSYRDERTEGMMEETFKIISKDKLYKHTGIQFLRFNTIYQLLAIKKKNPEILKKAKSFLMIPDYLNFLLTGKKVNEYTNASTTQLLNCEGRTWDFDLIEKMQINKDIFQEIKLPKTKLGNFKSEIVEEVGFDMEVILPATHDTGSAFISSVCNDDESIYLSSGTWSLIGIENIMAICTDEAEKYNFTNEGGIDYRYRFLKNIMGLWIIQEVKRNFNDKYSFSELVDLARECSEFESIIDVDDDRFLKPLNMIEEIKNYCKEHYITPPEKVGEVAMCVFNSLAYSYKNTILQLERISGRKFTKINIFGGGCQNQFLNEIVSKITEKTVLAGPVEATATGNIVSQFLALGKFKELKEARENIKKSFDIKCVKITK